MLGTFPKDFSQVATSPGYFPNRKLHKRLAAALIHPACSSRCALLLSPS